MVLISVTDGRFPRAWLQSPRRASSPAGSSAHAPVASLSVQKTSAIPAGKILDELSIRPISLRRVTAGAHVFSPPFTQYQITEVLYPFKGIYFKYSSIIHQKIFMKLTRLIESFIKHDY